MNSLFVVKCIQGITKAKELKLESKTYMWLDTENAAYSYEMAIFHLVSNYNLWSIRNPRPEMDPYGKIGFLRARTDGATGLHIKRSTDFWLLYLPSFRC